MRYKERRPTPHFKIPPPFNAVTGQYASLTGELGVSPYCVLMQVAAEDTYTDYVICRGFDTRMLVFVDYEEGDVNKPGIPVAKPYGRRKAGSYEVGEIHPALLPIQGNATYTPPSPTDIAFRLGQNPGVVENGPATGGHPRNLDEALILLYDENGVAINWLLIDSRSINECEDNLPAPGSYRAVSGGTIAGGEAGPVVYDGEVYQAVNQSECQVVIGSLVGFHVSPDCDLFFVPCVCDCNQVAPTICCDKYIAICINGETQILAVDGGTAQWTLTEDCCGCDSTPVFTITLSCDTETITATWQFECGSEIGNGTIDLSGLCADPVEEYSELLTVIGACEIRINATLEASECIPCDPCEECREATIDDSTSNFFLSTATINHNSLRNGDWFYIRVHMEMDSANTFSGRLKITFYGVSVIIDSATDAPGPTGGGPAVWTNPSGCDMGPVITWPKFTMGAAVGRRPWTFDVICRYNSCETPGARITFAIEDFGMGDRVWDENALTWPVECGECGEPRDPHPKPDPPDPEVPGEECCDKSIWLCLNNVSRQLVVDGGTFTWDVAECCDGCTTASLEVRLQCNRETNGVTLQWFYICDGAAAESGAITLVGICPTTVTQLVTIDASCFMQIQVSAAELSCNICGIVTDCCNVDEVPRSLVLVVSGGACPGTYELLWSSGQTWLDVDYPCGDIVLVCTGGNWELSVDMLGTALTSEQCDPFELVFDATAAGVGTVTVTG